MTSPALAKVKGALEMPARGSSEPVRRGAVFDVGEWHEDGPCFSDGE